MEVGDEDIMTKTVTAVFVNEGLAAATLAALAEIGIDNEMTMNQGSKIIQSTPTEDEWIAVYEVICSFGGEIQFTANDYEVINKMYHIPEESYEHDEPLTTKEISETGTLGNLNDQLADNAFIDPNFGIGNQDLLIPFLDPSNDDRKE